MSESAAVIFPHQLFRDPPHLSKDFIIYLIEEYLFFSQYNFHKQKIAFHRASMKKYADDLVTRGYTVEYVEAKDPRSDIRVLIKSLRKGGIRRVSYIDPTDDWLGQRITSTADCEGIECIEYPTLLFLNQKNSLTGFFKQDKKKYFQTSFYKEQRKKRNILLEADGSPVGGKWSFDAENRKKYPKNKIPPPLTYPSKSSYYDEARKYVEKYFPDNLGNLGEQPLYPIDAQGTDNWLSQFFNQRFYAFGDYEDAIVKEAHILNHSVLTPMLNIGLISPQYILDRSLDFAVEHNIPINSLEGFVRQIVGWREFVRGIYEVRGSDQRSLNFWNFTRKIPPSFYNGTTGIEPVDYTIKKVLKTAYCHHIERLMILGNFMVLCEFDPNEVYRWFMEFFIDAFDWVMVPNVYGMSQFADGGLLATKPYISGSNYIKKMSDYPNGEWQAIWDGLFWRFLHVHRNFFLKNPRLSMLVRTLDKMEGAKRHEHLKTAASFLDQLSG